MGPGPAEPLPADGPHLAAGVEDVDRILAHGFDDGSLQAANLRVGKQQLGASLGGKCGDLRLALGTTVAVPAIVIDECRAQGLDRRSLQVARDSREDAVTGGVDRLAVPLLQRRAHHLGEVGRVGLGLLGVQACRLRGVQRILVGRLVDIFQLVHPPEHVAAPGHRGGSIGNRVRVRRCLGQARDHRDLRDRELVEGGPVIDLRRGTDAVCALAEENLVQIEFENLVLAEFALDFDGQDDFLQLSLVGLLARQEEVARKLHRDRAATLALFLRTRDFDGRAHDGHPVDSRVFIEAVVLGGDESLLHQERHLADS